MAYFVERPGEFAGSGRDPMLQVYTRAGRYIGQTSSRGLAEIWKEVLEEPAEGGSFEDRIEETAARTDLPPGHIARALAGLSRKSKNAAIERGASRG